MTADFTGAPFSVVSHITITLDLAPGLYRVWPTLFLSSFERRVSGGTGRSLFTHWMIPLRLLKLHWWLCWQPHLPRDQRVLACSWHTALLCFWHIRLKNIRLFHTAKKPKNCAMSKVAASSARIESIYYSFLMARCEKEYKHIWQWNLRAAGTSLPQGSLPLLLYFGFLYMTQRYLWKQMAVSFYQL